MRRTFLKKLIKRLGTVLSTLSMVMILNINSAAAATRLTPYHLYLWAKNANVARLEEFKRYINIQDYTTRNTAICIAQQHKDYAAYKLLLQFGASVRVACHDNTDLQCRKIITEVGGIDTGIVLLGAAALGAGAIALAAGGGGGGGGSAGPVCDVSQYPLDSCPEHGVCSTCEEKYKLDSCAQFWQISGNSCVPAACPAGEYLKGGCPAAAAGTVLEEVPSSSFSGNAQCYRCNYICQESAGFYQDRATCQNTFPGYGCVLHANGCFIRGEALDCPQNESTECEPAEAGFTLTQTETGNLSGTQKCYLCTYAPKPCPADQYTEGNCPAESWQSPVYNPTENFSGNNRCYTCSYKCNTAGGYYDSRESCENANTNKSCDLKGGTGCYAVTGCNNAQGYYGTADEVTDLYPGYDTKYENGCFTRGDPKDCPDGTATYGKCPGITGGVAQYTNLSEGNFSGTSRCYNCIYICDTGNHYYASDSACKVANPGLSCTPYEIPGRTCYIADTCNIAEGYYENDTECKAANPGHICQPDEDSGCSKVQGCDNDNGYYDDPSEISPGYETIQQYGCYRQGEAKECPSGEEEQCYTSDPYKEDISTETGNFSGETPCKICAFQCRSQLGYYDTRQICQTTNQGHTCDYASGSTCFTPTGCNNALNYYKLPSECESANPGYNCYATRSPNGSNVCYTKNLSDPKKCPSGEYLMGQCPSKDGTTPDYNPTANKQGEEQCYTCTYQCNGTTHFTEQETCEDANPGRSCSQDADTGCFIRAGCNTADGYYENDEDCRTNSTGHLCEQEPDSQCYVQSETCDELNQYYNDQSDCENNYIGYSCSIAYGCYVKGEAKPCPDGEYIQCEEKPGTDVEPAETDNKSGENTCNTCEYKCDSAQGYYTTPDECPEENICTPDEASGCYKINGTAITNQQTTPLSIKNTQKIALESSGSEDIYGLKSSADITNAVDKTTGSAGSVNIEHKGTGAAYGIYAAVPETSGTTGETTDNAGLSGKLDISSGATGSLTPDTPPTAGTVINEAGASVNIHSHNGGDAYGIYAGTGGTVINSGSVNITGNAENAYGIYGEGQNTITNAGDIYVEGKNAYGIYVKDGSGTSVTNEQGATITVNTLDGQGNAHGIYIAENNEDAVVANHGIIKVNGTVVDGNAGIALNGARLSNYSLMTFSGDADLDALGGKIYLEDGGVYEAQSLKGDLDVGTSAVTGSNQDTYVQENSLKAEDISDLNLGSESALFKAAAQKNDSGSYDVVLNRRSFNEFTDNASLSGYLEQNYKEGKLTGLYDDIKSESTDFGTRQNIAGQTGFDTLLNFADENFQVLRSLNRSMADTILKPSDEPYRVLAGYDNFNLETNTKGILSGYELSSNSMYTFGDKRLDNKNRLGLGLSYGHFRDKAVVSPCFHTVPFGIMAGGRVFGFAELALGMLNIGATAGIGVRF